MRGRETLRSLSPIDVNTLVTYLSGYPYCIGAILLRFYAANAIIPALYISILYFHYHYYYKYDCLMVMNAK